MKSALVGFRQHDCAASLLVAAELYDLKRNDTKRFSISRQAEQLALIKQSLDSISVFI